MEVDEEGEGSPGSQQLSLVIHYKEPLTAGPLTAASQQSKGQCV